MAVTVGDLLVYLGIDMSDFQRDLESAGDRLERFGNRAFFLGARLTAGVTIPIAGVSAGLAKLGLDFDKAMTESLAITETVSADMREAMDDMAMQVSETLKFTAKEAAEGFYPLLSAGLDANEALMALPVTARFAQAGVMDLAKATEYLAGAEASMSRGMTEGAEKVKAMADIADVLTEANNRAIGNIQDFAAALSNRAGAALAQYGKSAAEGVAVLAAFAEQNIRGKAAGQQLWMVMRDLTTYALKNSDAFKRYNIAIFDSTGNMRNLADIIASIEKATEGMNDAQETMMLNQLGIPLRSVAATRALLGYSSAIREHERHLRSAAGVTEEVANKQMQALSNQLQVLKNSFANVGIRIFQAFVPVIQDSVIPLIESALQKFKGFATWVENLDPAFKKLALAGLAVVAAVGPLIGAIGSMSLLVRALIPVFGPVIGALGGWVKAAGLAAGGAQSVSLAVGILGRALAIVSNPVTAVIGTVATLGLGLKALGVDLTLLTGGVDVFGGAWSALKFALKVPLDLIRMTVWGLQDLWGAMKDGVQWLNQQARAIGVTKKEYGDFYGVIGKMIPTFGPMMDWFDAIERRFGVTLPDAIRKAKEWWDAFVLSRELRNYSPAKDVAATLPQAPKSFMFDPLETLEGKGKAQTWMLADDPFKFKARMDAKARGEDPDISFPQGPKELTGDAKKVADLAKELTGVNRELEFLKRAWDSLTPAQRANADTTDRLWQMYSKLAAETGVLVPEFDRLFESQWKSRDLAVQLEHAGKNWFDTWSDGLVELDQDAGRILVQMTEMTGTDINNFFKQHGGVIEEATGVYGKLGDQTKILVDLYWKWKAVASDAGSAVKDAARNARDVSVKMLGDTTAKIMDMEEQVQNFTASVGQQHRRTVRVQMAQIEKDQEQHLDRMLRDVSLFEGQALFEHQDRIQKQREANERYNTAHRIFLDQQFAQTLGVNRKTLRAFESMTDEQRKLAIEAQIEWNKFIERMQRGADNLRAYGDLFSTLGLEKFGETLSAVSGNVQGFTAAMSEFRGAEHFGEQVAAIAKMATHLISAYQKISQLETRGQRTASAAMTGMEIGGAMVPGWGHVIGLGIGALVGAMMDDPAWAKMRKAVRQQWGVNVTEELAKKIAADSTRLGSKVQAMLTNMAEVMAEDVLRPETVSKWAMTAQQLFEGVGKGSLTAADAAGELDQMFGQLVETGTTTNGLLNDQVRQLVALERQYNTGSKAIREFARAQMESLGTGFGAVAAGAFTPLIKAFDEAKQKLIDREGENTTTKVDIEGIIAPTTQAQFERLGRLAVVTFEAMRASGMSVAEAFAHVGPGLDTLIDAQKKLGLTTSDTVRQLLGFREFAAANPEVVAAVAGLDQMVKALHNTSFLTAEAFSDLGAEAASVFDAMVAKGLPADQALQLMQPTLQTLWQLQQKFGYEVDATTQKLIEQAAEAGLVGEQHMTATDRMVLGLENVIDRLDALLRGLGIALPDAVKAGADKMIAENDRALRYWEWRLRNFRPEFEIGYRYRPDNEPPSGYAVPRPEESYDEPTMLARGGVLSRPTFVAGEEGAEVVAPLDELWRRMESTYMQGARGMADAFAAVDAAREDSGGVTVIVVQGGKTPEETVDAVVRAFPRKVRHNEDGLRTQLLDALDEGF